MVCRKSFLKQGTAKNIKCVCDMIVRTYERMLILGFSGSKCSLQDDVQKSINHQSLFCTPVYFSQQRYKFLLTIILLFYPMTFFLWLLHFGVIFGIDAHYLLLLKVVYQVATALKMYVNPIGHPCTCNVLLKFGKPTSTHWRWTRAANPNKVRDKKVIHKNTNIIINY